jgi:hypothetical protein
MWELLISLAAESNSHLFSESNSHLFSESNSHLFSESNSHLFSEQKLDDKTRVGANLKYGRASMRAKFWCVQDMYKELSSSSPIGLELASSSFFFFALLTTIQSTPLHCQSPLLATKFLHFSLSRASIYSLQFSLSRIKGLPSNREWIDRTVLHDRSPCRLSESAHDYFKWDIFLYSDLLAHSAFFFTPFCSKLRS